MRIPPGSVTPPGPRLAGLGAALSAIAVRFASRLLLRGIPSPDDREVLARACEPPRAAGGHLDRVLHLNAAPAVLVVRRLDAKHHARLQPRLGRRVERRRVIRFEPDPVADVVALVARQSAFARDPHGDLEDLADWHASLHGADRCLLA